MSLIGSARRALGGKTPYHVGSVLPNRLGLQVMRAVSKHALWHLRPGRATNDHASTLERDGIVVLNNFLKPEQFARVRAEYEASKRSLPYVKEFDHALNVSENTYVDPAQVSDVPVAIQEELDMAKHPLAMSESLRLFRDSELIKEIVATAARRRVRIPPSASIITWRRSCAADSLVNERPRTRPRGEYMLHADTHYPTFKAWFYLSAVDESNGAFVFVRRSHKLSLERLKYEYHASVRVAESKKDGRWKTTPYGHIRQIDREYLDRMGVREEAICGPANTLVIANTSGFHRRGELLGEAPRETIHLNFRMLESWMNWVGFRAKR
jgi:hypothetical protein